MVMEEEYVRRIRWQISHPKSWKVHNWDQMRRQRGHIHQGKCVCPNLLSIWPSSFSQAWDHLSKDKEWYLHEMLKKSMINFSVNTLLMNMFLPFFFGYIVYLVCVKGKETRRKFGKVWNFNWLSRILEMKGPKKIWEILISNFSIEITNLNVNICLLTLRWKLNYNSN